MRNTTDRRTSGTPVTVRRATTRDAHTLQVLLLELAEHEGDGHHVHVDVDRWSQMLAELRVVVLLAESAGEPVGYVSAVHSSTCGSAGTSSPSTTSTYEPRHVIKVSAIC